jgi:hypothetical protein
MTDVQLRLLAALLALGAGAAAVVIVVLLARSVLG